MFLESGSGYGDTAFVGASTSETTPLSIAAAAVRILKVEPGGNVSRSGRLASGLLLSSRRALKRSLSLYEIPAKTSGLYEARRDQGEHLAGARVQGDDRAPGAQVGRPL
ncbi:hypothetical protein SMICM304S_09410 [Streptomyces microflavus]